MSAPGYNVCLMGLGSIGISFAALHLRYGTGVVTVWDPRPDLKQHIESALPGYLGSDPESPSLDRLQAQGRLIICTSLEEACANADIIQEQGPEQLAFKRETWSAVERIAPKEAHLWTSTSAIAASLQNQSMQDLSRLLVVHPFNPPHLMPLIEIVPSPQTSPEEVKFARGYFKQLGSGHRPVVIKRELPGFVGNRLAYILFREAAYLVKEDVVSVEDIDAIVEASLGPRFAVQGPFQAYNMGGGTAGIRGFLNNLSTTIQEVWSSYEDMKLGERGANGGSDWVEKVVRQTEDAYGMPTSAQFSSRDKRLRQVLEVRRQD